jgi:hypothetical protein
MKSKINIFSVVLFLSISVLYISFGQQKAEWKGKIEIEEGVQVIKNPGEPLYGEITFELKENLSIGNEKEKNYDIYQVKGIQVGGDGNIYVLDGGNCRIQIFDKNGQYLQTIGRKGQGPGEFNNPSDIHLDKKNNLYVKDRYKIHIFNKQSQYERSITLFENIRQFGINRDGNILAEIFSRPTRENMFQEVALFAPEGKKLKTIFSRPVERSLRLRSRTILGNPYSHRFYFCLLDEEFGIYGFSSVYKLFLINPSGDIEYIIENIEPPEPLTKKEKDEIIRSRWEGVRLGGQKISKGEIKKALKFPGYKPFFNRIINDDKSRIYIGRPKSRLDNNKNLSFDLYNKDGYFLYKIKIGIPPVVIKNGYIYSLSIDRETSYIKIKRYRIKNWDHIKEGI